MRKFLISLNRSGFLPIIMAFIAGGAAWSAFDYYDQQRELPVYNTVVDGKVIPVNSFRFLNEDSTEFQSKQIEGKPYIANFFFSTCPTVCPAMNDQFKTVLDAFPVKSLNGISFTVDPEYDHPAALKTYRDVRGYQNENWSFLTGEKKKIYSMAIRDFMMVAAETPQEEVPFIHSDKIVLVDKRGFIRGYYSSAESESIDDLKRDIKKLLNKS